MILNIYFECRNRMLNAGYDKPEDYIITCFSRMDDVADCYRGNDDRENTE